MPEFSPVFKLSSLNGTNGFRINGVASGDNAGISVATGDVNGDGFADLIIGAHRTDVNGFESGSAYVLFGSAAGFSSSVNLSSLSGANGFRLVGTTAFDYAGLSVTSAGDINGDGFDDLVVGAPGSDITGDFAGSSYIVFGKASLFASSINLSALNGSDGFRIDGPFLEMATGWSVNTAGDINGDGFDDLLIGAPDSNFYGFGASYVVFGKNSPFSATLNLSTLNGTNGFSIAGRGGPGNLGGSFGYSVASAGDVNGDGFDDIIVGDPYLSNAYIIYGKNTGFGTGLSMSQLNGLNGFALYGFGGVAVAGLGDINGDGYDDFGASGTGGAGSVIVVFGKPGFSANVTASSINGTNGFRIEGMLPGDSSGFSFDSAGDVNGDGFDDIVIGAKDADITGNLSGSSYVVFGKASGFASSINLATLNGNTGFRIDGIGAGNISGYDVSSAGDLNKDGFDDLLIGAPGFNTSAGAGFVFYGHRAESDVLRIGTDLANRINGGFGDDTISGLTGNDTILGWEGNDSISGGSGADRIIASDGEDTISGGSERDTLSFEDFTLAVTIDLSSGSYLHPNGEDVQIFSSIENVVGSSKNDVITGDLKANSLNGGVGNDTLSGGTGNDTLIGLTGRDAMTGGTGVDSFRFSATNQSGTTSGTADTIADFVHLTDKIDVGAIDAIAGGANDAFSFIGASGFTLAGQIRATQLGADTLIEFNTSSTSGAEMALVLQNFTAATLTGADFVL